MKNKGVQTSVAPWRISRSTPGKAIIAALSTAALVSVLTGCGQKGPLYLPNSSTANTPALAPSSLLAKPATP